MQFIPPYDQVGVTPPGPWTNAAPQAGIPGSIVNADVFPAVQNELLAIIAADPSLTASTTDLGQAQKSIAYQIAQALTTVPEPGATGKGGLAKDSSNNFLLALLTNLTADNRAAPVAADVLPLGRATDGAMVSVTAADLAAYIASTFKAGNTFVEAPTSATAVQATFGMAADQPVSSGVTTTVALAGQNAPFASIANGQITITETGIYNISATLLGNSHQPSGELQYAVVVLNQNGNLLEQTLTSVLSFGSALIAAGAGRPAFCSAGDIITLALYTHSQNFDDTGDTITASGTSLTIVKEA